MLVFTRKDDNKKMRKCFLKLQIISSILALLVGATGCQNSDKVDKPVSPVPEQNGPLNPVGQFPIAKEKTKLSILMQQDILVQDYETNAFTKWLEEKCNIDLDFTLLPPGSDGTNKLALMISSNQTLPDVVNVSLNPATTLKYGSGGAFIPLNDYYDKYSYYIKQQIQKYPQLNIIESTKAADGKLYSIPSYYKTLHDEVKYKYWINTKWLDKLGLKMPTTTDEFYNVLKAFKEKDPNGNGKADEFSLVGATGWSQDPTIYLMNAFVFDDSDNRFIVENGKVSVAYTTNGWKEGLRYINKLVSAGLLNPISFTQNDPQFRAMVDNPGDSIVGTFANSSITLLPATSPYINDYYGLEPLKGPNGVRYASFTETAFNNRWFVSRDCKIPELAFRVGDAMFNEDAFIRGRYGVEGKDWVPAQPGEKTPDGRQAMFKTMNNLWAVAQNAYWRNNIPAFTVEAMQSEVSVNTDPLFYGNRIGAIIPKYQAVKPQPGTFVNRLIFNEDEVNQISEIQTTLKTYVNESKTRFITGDLNVDKEWDAYIKEINNIGLDKFLKVCQAAYDRMYKK